MPRSVNRVTLLGHLGKDAETRYTPSGASVSSFSLATTRKWKNPKSGEWDEETTWHNIVAWRVENLAAHLTKGRAVYLEGRLQSRSYDAKDGTKRYVTEVVAENIILLGGDKGEGKPRQQKHEEPAFDPGPRDNAPIDDLDVPF